MIEIKYKGDLPLQSNIGTDTGFDIIATKLTVNIVNGQPVLTYNTNVALKALTKQLDLQLRCRSSIYKKSLVLTNGVGTIDEHFSSPMSLKFALKGYSLGFHNNDTLEVFEKEGIIRMETYWGMKCEFHIYAPNERIGQLVVGAAAKNIKWIQAFDMEEDRGGFGSSGS